MDRLDGERIEILRRWGRGLAASGRDEEIRAAGRAIELLGEEIDALKRDLWHARAGVSSELGADPPQGRPPGTERQAPRHPDPLPQLLPDVPEPA